MHLGVRMTCVRHGTQTHAGLRVTCSMHSTLAAVSLPNIELKTS